MQVVHHIKTHGGGKPDLTNFRSQHVDLFALTRCNLAEGIPKIILQRHVGAVTAQRQGSFPGPLTRHAGPSSASSLGADHIFRTHDAVERFFADKAQLDRFFL